VEQLAAMLLDETSTQERTWDQAGLDLAVPPSLSALLAARLDRLAGEERTVIAEASVVGQVFYRGALHQLSPPKIAAELDPSLETLKRKQFITDHESDFLDDLAYAFRHVLIRDAAYEGMLKKTRAELHERFAGWLQSVAGSRVTEFEEILGYHYEQAYRYRVALRPEGPADRSLAMKGAALLSSAGHRAFEHSDLGTTTDLISRALSLLKPGDATRLEPMIHLAEAELERGNLEGAQCVLRDASAAARASGARHLEARARVLQLRLEDLRGYHTSHLSPKDGWMS
jgi:predicted ATPase